MLCRNLMYRKTLLERKKTGRLIYTKGGGKKYKRRVMVVFTRIKTIVTDRASGTKLVSQTDLLCVVCLLRGVGMG